MCFFFLCSLFFSNTCWLNPFFGRLNPYYCRAKSKFLLVKSSCLLNTTPLKSPSWLHPHFLKVKSTQSPSLTVPWKSACLKLNILQNHHGRRFKSYDITIFHASFPWNSIIHHDFSCLTSPDLLLLAPLRQEELGDGDPLKSSFYLALQSPECRDLDLSWTCWTGGISSTEMVFF